MALSLRSVLKPETSVLVGLASGGIIVGIYTGALPTMANVRVADSDDGDIERTRRSAAWTSAATLGFLFLLTRDRNSFLIGGLVLAGVDLSFKIANGVNPLDGMLEPLDRRDDSMPEAPEMYAVPDDTESFG